MCASTSMRVSRGLHIRPIRLIMCVSVNACVRICMNNTLLTHMHALYINTHTHTHTHTHIHTHTHTHTHIYIYIYIYNQWCQKLIAVNIYPPIPRLVGCDTRSILKRNITTLNSEIPFSLTRFYTTVKEPCLLNYLPISGADRERERERERERGDVFVSFPRASRQIEMHTASVKFWTWNHQSIFHVINRYATRQLILINVCMYIYRPTGRFSLDEEKL